MLLAARPGYPPSPSGGWAVITQRSGGDPIVGVVVVDRSGRVVDGDARLRQRVARPRDLLRRLVRLARSGGGDHLLAPGLRARVFAGPDGEAVVFLSAPEPPRQLALADLTPRERVIALHVGAGRSAPWIAARLGVAVATVRWHLTNVYRKTDLPTWAALREAVREQADRRPRVPLDGRRRGRARRAAVQGC